MMSVMSSRASFLVLALGASACGLATDFHGDQGPATAASSSSGDGATSTGDAATSTAEAASTAQSGGQAASSGAGGAPGAGGGGGDVTSRSAAAAGGVADGDDGTGGAEPFCGDGEVDLVDEREECDDGDDEEGDGCSPSCKLECAVGESARIATGTCLALAHEEDQARTWSQARASCEEEGGDLVVLPELALPTFDGRLDLAHVGGQRIDGDFEWVDGTEVVAPIEEDDAGDCLAARFDEEGITRLVAVACSLPLAFVCERDPAR
jgi:cysteine-rich repeat protein